MDYRMRNACREGDLNYIIKEIDSFYTMYLKKSWKYPQPIFFCAAGGQNEAIEYFIGKKLYNLDILLESIGIAAISNHMATVELLCKIVDKDFFPQHPKILRALEVCISKNYKKMAEYLIQKGAYIVTSDSTENTLVKCAEANNTEIMEIIMNKDPNFRESIPNAINTAIMLGHRNSVNFLAGTEMV